MYFARQIYNLKIDSFPSEHQVSDGMSEYFLMLKVLPIEFQFTTELVQGLPQLSIKFVCFPFQRHSFLGVIFLSSSFIYFIKIFLYPLNLKRQKILFCYFYLLMMFSFVLSVRTL